MGLTYPSNKICPRCGTGGYVWYMDNTKYVAKCINCGHYFQKEDFPMCVLDRTGKSTTNADRIRAMSDEELDKFLGEVQWDVANYCGGVTQKQEYPVPEQRGAWLDWLKKEAE